MLREWRVILGHCSVGKDRPAHVVFACHRVSLASPDLSVSRSRTPRQSEAGPPGALPRVQCTAREANAARPIRAELVARGFPLARVSFILIAVDGGAWHITTNRFTVLRRIHITIPSCSVVSNYLPRKF